MNSVAKFHEFKEAPGSTAGGQDKRREVVLSELDRILASRFFRSAERSQQFLRYVVERKLAGQAEQLKERTIGTEVFLRPQGYSTGEDSVVRVQAGEVRRRIEQYYQATAENTPVRIEIPIGSYSPVFHWVATSAPSEIPPLPSLLPDAQPAVQKSHRMRYIVLASFCLILLLVAGRMITVLHRNPVQHPAHKSEIEQFWNPVFASQQPAVICLGSNLLLPLDANTKVPGKATFNHPLRGGVPNGDVYAALEIYTLLGRMSKTSQVRIGSNCSFDDLRSSPAIIVGAFNNKWTLQLLSNLHFAFVDEKGEHMIREQGPEGKVWTHQSGLAGGSTEDFAIVSRLLDSKTGQFTIIAAGVGQYGTQAAGDFISNPQYLEQALRNVPADWPKKNLEILMETMGTDSIAGPPRIVATYFW